MTTKLNCISLFSGAGGLDEGAKKAGLNPIICIDNDPDSIKSLKLNFNEKETNIIERDIEKINFKDWRDMNNSIIIGGPPCQPFSKNGYWVKNTNRMIDDDPRNLLGQFIRSLKEIKPKAFLFENVESILHPTNKKTFEKFLFSAEAQGYSCTTYKANSQDFGVPQKRKRVFVFGIKGLKSKIPLPKATHGSYDDRNLFENLLPYEGVEKFIKDFKNKKFSEKEEDASKGTYYYELTQVPAGKNYLALSKIKNYKGKKFEKGKRFWNFLFKLDPALPSITIAANPGPWVGPFHWENRRLRAKEIAAIQTFPKSYKFYGNRRSLQRQIGNAVPVILAENMVKHLIKHL